MCHHPGLSNLWKDLCVSFLLECIYVHICVTGVQGGKKRALDPLELELETVVNWYGVLKIKPSSSKRTVTACNC